MSKEIESGFEKNYKKLEGLAQALQENKVGIDELVPKMKEALSSIKVCKQVLHETKSQLKEIEREFEEIELDKELEGEAS